RAVSEHRPESSRPAAALRLSLAQRLGLRAARRPNTAWRVEPVGRPPRARGGPLCEEARHRRAVPRVLRAGMNSSRTALVTGGTRGIGLRIAPALATGGWQLSLCGVRGEAGASELIDDLRQRGTTGLSTPADLASRDDRARLVAAVRSQFGAVN